MVIPSSWEQEIVYGILFPFALLMDLVGSTAKFWMGLYFISRFTIGIILYLILVPISALTGFNYTNCWLYAIKKYLQYGGYIVFRETHWNRGFLTWEHALWSPNLKEFYSLVPRNSKKPRWFPPPLFQGKVIKVINDIPEIVIEEYTDVLC